MKRNFWLPVLGVLVALIFILTAVLFTVHEGEIIVLTTFGRPVRAINHAGLYVRWPWPIQKVYRFDGRIQTFEGPLEQSLTSDGKSIIVTLYAGWRIADAMRFLERVGTRSEAEHSLNTLLANYKNAVIGRYPFSSLVNTDRKKLKFDRIEQEILAAVGQPAKTRYGIEVSFIGIRRLLLPESITRKVFERMRAERETIAEHYRAEGAAEATRIRAEADSRRDQILAHAEADAKRIRAEGDAEAAEYYRTFAQDPELAMFLRKLEVLEETLTNRATVILGPDTPPYDLLRSNTALPRSATNGEVRP